MNTKSVFDEKRFKKIVLKYPHIPENLDDKAKKTAESLAKTFAIFNAAGAGKRKADIVAWGQNRHYYIRELFYLYLFNKYKNSCISFVTPNCIALSDICESHGSFDLQLYAFPISACEKKDSYEKYLKNFAAGVVKCLKKRKAKLVVVPVILNFRRKPNACRAFGSRHANLIIFRREAKIIEIYEPHGSEFRGFSKREEGFHNITKAYDDFIDIFNNSASRNGLSKYKTIQTNVVTPLFKGFQSIEDTYKEIYKYKSIEGGGYCSVWSMFITELVLRNPEVNTSDIIRTVYDMLLRDNRPKGGKKYDDAWKKTDWFERSEVGTYLFTIARGYATFIIRKVLKYYELVFGGDNLEMIKLGNKYYVPYYSESSKLFGRVFNIFLEIQQSLILNNMTIKKLKGVIESRKSHPLKTKYKPKRGASHEQKKDWELFTNLIDNMIKQEEKLAIVKPVLSEEEMIIKTVTKYKWGANVAPKCPKGKVLNPMTGRCIKEKVPKIKKVKAQGVKAQKAKAPKKVKVVREKGGKKAVRIKKVVIGDTCGVNPNSGRCKIGMPNDSKCKLIKGSDGSKNCSKVAKPKAKKQMKVIKDKGKNKSKSKKDGGKKEVKVTCGVNPNSGRCKLGMPNDSKCKLIKAKDGANNCSKVKIAKTKIIKPKTTKPKPKVKGDGKKKKIKLKGKVKKKRCPNGTRRNPKTGRCKKVVKKK